MTIYIEKEAPKGQKIIASLMVLALLAEFLALAITSQAREAKFASSPSLPLPTLSTIQQNTFLGVYNPFQPITGQKVDMLVTGYSSTSWQTDGDPFVTASGSKVKDGVVANNLLPFGTKIKIPELYGDKVFIVEDRMHWRKSKYHLDIWFSEYQEALNFGRKIAYIEVLEN